MCSGIAFELSAMIGPRTPARRSDRHTAYPSRPGIWMSRMIRSNRSARARSWLRTGSATTTTSWPSCSSTSVKSSRLSASSSTKSRRVGRLLPAPADRDLLEPSVQAHVIDRLAEVVIGAQRPRPAFVVLDRDDHHRHVTRARAALQEFEDFLAAAIPQPEVQDDARRDRPLDRAHRVGDGRDDLRGETMLRRESEHEVGVATFVLDDQHPRSRGQSDNNIREMHAERRAFAFGAGEADRPALELDEALRQGETQACAGGGRTALVQPLERPEDAAVLIGRDADPVVCDDDLEVRL